MTETCGGSVSDLGSIHASQSDYSITNSSPRLESNASSSTACTELRRDFGTDLICAICGELFTRPVMVACGHSFCESCIEVHCRTSRNCSICEKDVGDFGSMIPSITLENIVNKIRSQEIVNSFDDLFIYDESRVKSKIERSLSTRSKKRCFFTIAAPTICSSPVTEKRKQPVLSDAKPSKSALKYPSHYHSTDEQNTTFAEEEHDEADGEKILSGNVAVFKRNGYGRRSERYTSSTREKSEDISKIPKVANQSLMIEPDKLKRNSFFRRSLNAFRSKTGRRSFNEIKEEPHEESQVLLNSSAPSGEGEASDKSSAGKSLWRRFFVARKVSNNKIQQLVSSNDSVTLLSCHPKKKEMGFCRLEEHEEDHDGKDGRVDEMKCGYYIGIGKKFERKRRLGGNQEISIVVFGPSHTGKTLFVKELRKLFFPIDDSSNIQLIPVTKRYAMGGLRDTPYPEGDNRLPHVVSFMVQFDDGTSTVIDIIDPEYDSSYLPESYMRVCDAALFLIDNKNCGTVLTAYQIFRNMRNDENRCMLECDMIVNCRVDATGKTEKRVNSAVCDNFAKTMKASVYEMNIKQIDKSLAETILMSLAKRVIDSRIVASSLGTAV